MSNDFEKLNQKYKLNYITKSTLRRWVELNKLKPSIGITAEEYATITGEAY